MGCALQLCFRKRLLRSVIVFTGLVFGLLSPLCVIGDTRVALVIGNADYGDAGILPTPVADAAMMFDVLKALDFRVRLHTNLPRRDLERELNSFLQLASISDIAVLYYSGHQLHIGGNSFLVPGGTPPKNLESAHLSLIDLNEVLTRLRSAATRNVFILEGGWKAPFVAELNKTAKLAEGGRAITSMLDASIGAARPNMLYSQDDALFLKLVATQPGQYNPSEPNYISTFTNVLATELDQPDRSLSQVASAIQARLKRQTRARQVPSFEKMGAGKLYLSGMPIIGPKSVSVPKNQQALKRWRSVSQSDSVSELSLFIQEFGDTPLLSVALDRLAEMTIPRNSAVPEQQIEPVDLAGLQLSPSDLPRTAFSIPQTSYMLLDDVSDGAQNVQSQISREGYSVIAIDQEFVTRRETSLHKFPWDHGQVVAALTAGERIVVTGKVSEYAWYRVRRGEGPDLYVKAANIQIFSDQVADAGQFNGAFEPVLPVRQLVVPAKRLAVLDTPLTADKIINIRDVFYNGRQNESLTASLMQKFGATTKTRITNEHKAWPKTAVDVLAKLVSVKIADGRRTSILPLDLLHSGTSSSKVENARELRSYKVTVSLDIIVLGESDPLIVVDSYELQVDAQTIESTAISIAAKRAFDRAVNQVLPKLHAVMVK